MHNSLNDSDNMRHLFDKKGIVFTLKLHNNDNFTRKNVVEIQKNVLANIIEPLLSSVRNEVEQSNSDNDIERQLFVNSLNGEIYNPFRLCKNETQLFDWLLKNDYICNHEMFLINRQLTEKFSRGEIHFDEVDIAGIYISLPFQFRKYFEKNDRLLKTSKAMEKITNDRNIYSNFLHGSLWRQKSQTFSEEGKICLPFFLYIDDAEINNPLGPHTNPVSFIYYSFPMLEDAEVFLAATIQGNDYKEYGNDQCFRTIVRDIKWLEENGITIKISDGEKTVHFILGLFLGDNLGLNTVLGFTTSFNHIFFCRFCKLPKEVTHTLCVNNPDYSRNIDNYDDDVTANDIGSTGIKESSIFNSIHSFHVTTNFAVCVMHDIFEGVCHYDMCQKCSIMAKLKLVIFRQESLKIILTNLS